MCPLQMMFYVLTTAQPFWVAVMTLTPQRALPLLTLHCLPEMTGRVYLSFRLPAKPGSLTLPPPSARPAIGRLYEKPWNWFCIVCDRTGPSTYESCGASEVNSGSKLAVSKASA